VLYPQTRSSSLVPYNPQACWDWYIDHTDSYVTKSGAQIRTTKAMLDAVLRVSNRRRPSAHPLPHGRHLP
jgi:hypothetical protein